MTTVYCEICPTQDLLAQESALRELAEDAEEENISFESLYLFPALALRKNEDLQFLLVWRGEGEDKKLLCFLPFVLEKKFRKLPFVHAKVWQHLHALLGTPLVRKGALESALPLALTALWKQGLLFLEIPCCGIDGPFYPLLCRLHEEGRISLYFHDRNTRPLFAEKGTFQEYFQSRFRRKRQKKFEHYRRDLEAMGELRFLRLSRGEDLWEWTEQFLDLEASGWKKEEGTALACRREEREFFSAMVARAWELGRLDFFALQLDGKALAMKCNLRSQDRSLSYAFKTAFDESFRKWGPGIVLEFEVMEQALKGGYAIDSCAEQGHELLSSLFPSERNFATLCLAPPSLVPRLIFMSFGVLRKLKQRGRSKAASEVSCEKIQGSRQ